MYAAHWVSGAAPHFLFLLTHVTLCDRIGRNTMKRSILLGAAAAALAFTTTVAFADRTSAPEGASAYIISPSNGETVKNPVTIKFGLSGMGIAPAGIEQVNTGHHHLLINLDPTAINFDEPLPVSDEVVHFGGGQTEVTKDLPAGTHTIRLLLGDHDHIPHEPPVLSEPVTITVQ